MRRRPSSRGSRFSPRSEATLSADSRINSAPISRHPNLSFADIRDADPSPGEFSATSESTDREDWCRALHQAIHEVTRKFEEAQQEYQTVAPNSCEWHKWKGEMIAYANAVALLESLKTRTVLVP